MSARATSPSADPSERVLVLVRGARDVSLTVDLLRAEGVAAAACGSVVELCDRMKEGAAAALLEEEVFDARSLATLHETLRQQPPWSDFPLLVFSTFDRGLPRKEKLDAILGNVTFLDRPVRARTMLAAVQAALRSRRRQYEGRHAIESRDTFLAMLGHELRNPLGAIHLALDVLERRDAMHSREHAIIARQSKHLARLVDDLLDVARVTRGSVVLQRARISLGDALRGAFEALEPRAASHGIALSLDASGDDPLVDGDRARLEQVFSNLLTNAIKYTPAGGTVTVTVRRQAGDALVTVADTGVGLAPEMLERVFDVFAQVERTLERREGGMGLGLAIVRSIVALHGGSVVATSDGVGRGSTFTVRLPTVAAEQSRPPPARKAENGLSLRVVIVEDSPDNRDMLSALLELQGHRVESAGDGPEGLDKILAVKPDIALVDLGLPGFDGLELARRARAAGATSRLVALTGYGQPEDRARAHDAGFDDHLTKPVSDGELRNALRTPSRQGGVGKTR